VVIDRVLEQLRAFCDERNWSTFHTPGELARALSVEAAELNELYLWDRDADPEHVKDELADVLIYALFLLDEYNFDLEHIIERKIEANRQRYTIEKSKGNADKQ